MDIKALALSTVTVTVSFGSHDLLGSPNQHLLALTTANAGFSSMLFIFQPCGTAMQRGLVKVEKCEQKGRLSTW